MTYWRGYDHNAECLDCDELIVNGHADDCPSQRKYRLVEPGEGDEPVVQEITAEGIVETYYPTWQELMRKAGKEDLISVQECIQDFIVVHWAEEVPPTRGR